MTKWECGKCGYLLEAEQIPESCPSCKEKCSFNNVTCYTPECGGEQNIDPQLFGNKEIKKKRKKK
jgi:rubredoxin